MVFSFIGAIVVFLSKGKIFFAPIAPAIIVLSLFVAEEIKIKVVLKIISLLCATTPRFRFGAICVNTSQRSFHIPPCKVTI